MNESKKINYFMYPLIISAMEKEEITIAHLSHLTGIAPQTLSHILENEENFEKIPYRTLQVLLYALKINERMTIDEYYKTMYDLGEDDSNVIAITNIVEGARSFKLSEDDFKLVVKLLERLSLKEY